jgi:hypothetical protein
MSVGGDVPLRDGESRRDVPGQPTQCFLDIRFGAMSRRHTRRSGIEAVGAKLVRSKRDADPERRSLADFTFGDQRTAVQFDELLDQRKTNAGSLE